MAVDISTDLRKDLQDLIVGWLNKLSPVGGLDEAEGLALEVRQIVGEIVLETSLLRITGKATYRGSQVPCSCGCKRRFVDYRPRWVKSPCGEVQVSRAYYHCTGDKHHEGRKQDPPPWDAEQGLTKMMGTPRFKALVCRVMGVTPYSDGVDLISELCNVDVEESTAEDMVMEVGSRIRAAEQQRVETVKLRLERATEQRLLVDAPERAPLPALETRPVVGNRIYFGMDALTAHIGGDWHNVQNGVVFTVKEGKDGRDTLLRREYTAGRWTCRRLDGG